MKYFSEIMFIHRRKRCWLVGAGAPESFISPTMNMRKLANRETELDLSDPPRVKNLSKRREMRDGSMENIKNIRKCIGWSVYFRNHCFLNSTYGQSQVRKHVTKWKYDMLSSGHKWQNSLWFGFRQNSATDTGTLICCEMGSTDTLCIAREMCVSSTYFKAC